MMIDAADPPPPSSPQPQPANLQQRREQLREWRQSALQRITSMLSVSRDSPLDELKQRHESARQRLAALTATAAEVRQQIAASAPELAELQRAAHAVEEKLTAAAQLVAKKKKNFAMAKTDVDNKAAEVTRAAERVRKVRRQTYRRIPCAREQPAWQLLQIRSWALLHAYIRASSVMLLLLRCCRWPSQQQAEIDSTNQRMEGDMDPALRQALQTAKVSVESTEHSNSCKTQRWATVAQLLA